MTPVARPAPMLPRPLGIGVGRVARIYPVYLLSLQIVSRFIVAAKTVDID